MSSPTHSDRKTAAQRLSRSLGLVPLILATLACSAEKPHRPTSVLLITVDTLRADHLGPYADLLPPGALRPSTPNIDARFNSQVAEVRGEERLETIVIRDTNTDQLEEVECGGMFIFIGARPHSDFLEGVVGRDPRGFVLTGPDVMAADDLPTPWPLDRDPFLMETSVPGIFAAGDVRAGVVRRVASAVGQGAICVSMIHGYLDTV